MLLFQSTVATKYLNTQEISTLSEHWQKFQTHFYNLEIQENIRNSKEEQKAKSIQKDIDKSNAEIDALV